MSGCGMKIVGQEVRMGKAGLEVWAGKGSGSAAAEEVRRRERRERTEKEKEEMRIVETREREGGRRIKPRRDGLVNPTRTSQDLAKKRLRGWAPRRVLLLESWKEDGGGIEVWF